MHSSWPTRNNPLVYMVISRGSNSLTTIHSITAIDVALRGNSKLTTKAESRLSLFNLYKTVGTEKVSPYVLKMYAKELSKPLYIILSKSLNEGSLPNRWSEANITRIFKKGSRIETAYYRQVSLT